jgi:hypothetical protein
VRADAADLVAQQTGNQRAGERREGDDEKNILTYHESNLPFEEPSMVHNTSLDIPVEPFGLTRDAIQRIAQTFTLILSIHRFRRH